MKAKTNVSSFTDAEILEAALHYIEPDASNVDPANEDDLREFAFVREPVFSALDRTLSSSDKVHILVLADSGMGKTTLLLNFFSRELRRSNNQKRQVAMVPLSRGDAIDQIRAVTEKRSTILLLDAMDEDTHAIQDHSTRLQQIMETAADFKSVIVTCRTQFFTSDIALPTATGISRVSPKRAGSTGTHHFKRIYLLPFSSKQVKAYISRTIPWHRLTRRRQAQALVERIPELSVRPMLLALLPDLLERQQELREVWDLYAFMVESWLTRESHWIDPKELLAVSEKVAVEIFIGREKRRSERLQLTELSDLLAKSASNIETWKLTTRSLLNRDAAGNYKFAHRSIMEFLFIRALIAGDNRCLSVQWTDMMCTLFLSWGRSAMSMDDAAQKRVQALFESDDLSKTGIFPLVDTYQPASRIDLGWAKRALGQSNLIREHAGIPPRWRRWTSRLRQRHEVARIYEFSEGLVWQFVITKDSADANLYLVSRSEARARDRAGVVWERPTLVEFRSLIETLLAHHSPLLDWRAIYWLADEDDHHVSMARLRDNRSEREAPDQYQNGATLILSAPIGQDGNLSADVYAVPKMQIVAAGQRSVPPPMAQQVSVLRGDAQRQWQTDTQILTDAPAWALSIIVDPPARPNVLAVRSNRHKL